MIDCCFQHRKRAGSEGVQRLQYDHLSVWRICRAARNVRSLIVCLIGVPLTAQLYLRGIQLAVSDIALVVLAAIST